MHVTARPFLAGILSLLAAAVVAACDPAVDENEGGGPPPQQLAGEVYPGERRELVGQLDHAANGCRFVVVDGDRRFAIWPAGTRDVEGLLVLPGGDRLAGGDPVAGIGTVMPARRLVGDGNGYWGSTIGYCEPDADLVVVFDAAHRP